MLFVGQPAVTARAKPSGRSLGAALFERGREGLVLSVAGRALQAQAEQLLRGITEARRAVLAPRGAGGGALQIAASPSICTYLLPEVLKRFQVAHPKVTITVRAGHSK